ncbi:MAG TPA: acyl-CoA dehydrogenase [Alphaproteobacteria bacterium]|nr:acyl-CoA dehydrogenase [Alphaproteobacteria bacterium]
MFRAPLRQIRFTLEHVAGLDRLRSTGEGDALAPELLDAVFEAAARLAEEVLAPLQRVGDLEGCKLENGAVATPPGWREAYRQFAEGGWNGLPFPVAIGGQDLPWTIAAAVQELWHGANTAFALCPLLNQGAVELLHRHADPMLRERYLPKLVSGTWAGTMNLTEPQAGSDLGAIRTRARREGETWRIKGQKLFITYGEHDLTENIVHLVLARTEGAPEGTRGLSLFLVPKFLPGAEGSIGVRNDLRCVSLEEKLGIHASPTCLMAYGDAGGATGYLVGRETGGIEAMFTMMNNARLGVGVQGIGIAERAAQMASAHAASRVQGRALGAGSSEPVQILKHPDVRRMLLSMRLRIEAMRALALSAALALDLAQRDPDPETQRREQLAVDLLTPVVKAWSTDGAVEIASLALQVHGGMGFIEETGIAQLYRDARITPIYEGTNGIQANDLVFRKLGRDDGAAARAYIGSLREMAAEVMKAPGESLAELGRRLAEGHSSLEGATEWMVEALGREPRETAAAASAYLRLFGTVAGGALLARGALAALREMEREGPDRQFLQARIAAAQSYAAMILPEAGALAAWIQRGGARAVLDHPESDLAPDGA